MYTRHLMITTALRAADTGGPAASLDSSVAKQANAANAATGDVAGQTPVTASAPADTRLSVGDTAIDADPTTLELTYGDYKVPVRDLPAKALAYLLQNGFSQSMTDAAAMTKAQKQIDTGEKQPATNDDGTPKVDDKGTPIMVPVMRDMTDAELDAKVKELRDARFAKILAGEVGIRAGGPRANPLDTIMRQVATEHLRARLAKQKLSLPTGKGKDGKPKTITVSGKPMTRDELVAAYLAKNDAEVRAEATRRLESAKEDADLVENLDDVLG